MSGPTPLVLLRHGPTAWNGQGRLQGRSDQPLTAAGETEVRRWRLPAGMHHWRRCASPLLRARRTAALLSPAMPYAVVSELIEMDFGTWEGRSLAELRAEGGAAFRDNERRGLDMTPPGGESPRQVIARLRSWLASVGASQTPTVAVVHKGIIRAMLAHATGWTMHDNPPIRLRSQALHRFAVARDGGLTMVRPNIPLGAGRQELRPA